VRGVHVFDLRGRRRDAEAEAAFARRLRDRSHRGEDHLLDRPGIREHRADRRVDPSLGRARAVTAEREEGTEQQAKATMHAAHHTRAGRDAMLLPSMHPDDDERTRAAIIEGELLGRGIVEVVDPDSERETAAWTTCDLAEI